VGVLKEHLYKEVLIRGAILRELNAYLDGRIPLTELVAWAQDRLAEGDLPSVDEDLLRDLVAHAGEPGSDGFGLTLEACSDLLGRLGQELRFDTRPASRAQKRGGDVP
jgi:hypothetical protein